MEYRLRLADRRGLLQGKNLSRVQEQAVELLMVADARDRSRQFSEEFKSRLGAANPEMLKHLWPEHFGDGSTTEVSDEGEVTEVHEISAEEFVPDAGTGWSYTEEMDPEEGKRILEQMASEWTMKGSDLGDDEGWV